MRKNATRYGLLLNEVLNDGGYYHLRLGVITLGPTADERNWFDGNPDYKLVGHNTVRNPRSEDPMSGLLVNSQGENANRGRLYGWEVEYRDVFSVDKRRAEGMYKTLAKLEKGMAKLQEKYGYPDSFGAYVGRVADVLGVDTVLVPVGPAASFYSDQEFRFLSVGDGVAEVNHRVAKWAKVEEPVS